MSLYEIILLGDVPVARRAALTGAIKAAVADFRLVVGLDLVIRDAGDAAARSPKAPTVVAYFLGERPTDVDLACRLLDRGVPVVPVIPQTASFELLPHKLQIPSGMMLAPGDPDLEALAASLLEAVGLLRQQRRMFISYRRAESRAAAVQLHDLHTGRGFDVFLDTHDIRPGEPFQEVLWHRMTDSDVMVVLDTRTYFEHRWTREEFGKAMAKEIHILRLVWPGHRPAEHLDTGEMIRLDFGDLTSGKLLRHSVAAAVAARVERLRSRSIAARLRVLTDKLRAEVSRIGGRIEAIGAHHAITLRLSRGRRIWAYPAVGIPTASLLHEIAERAARLDDCAPVLIYDHAGIRDSWIRHLDWLDSNLRVVDAIKVFEAGARLTELDV